MDPMSQKVFETFDTAMNFMHKQEQNRASNLSNQIEGLMRFLAPKSENDEEADKKKKEEEKS